MSFDLIIHYCFPGNISLRFVKSSEEYFISITFIEMSKENQNSKASKTPPKKKTLSTAIW